MAWPSLGWALGAQHCCRVWWMRTAAACCTWWRTSCVAWSEPSELSIWPTPEWFGNRMRTLSSTTSGTVSVVSRGSLNTCCVPGTVLGGWRNGSECCKAPILVLLNWVQRQLSRSQYISSNKLCGENSRRREREAGGSALLGEMAGEDSEEGALEQGPRWVSEMAMGVSGDEHTLQRGH